jgi:hypothetical protein
LRTRSLSFAVGAVVYAGCGVLPAVWTFFHRHSRQGLIGGATYAVETMAFLPLLTAAFAAITAADGLRREQVEGSWTTLSLTPLSTAGMALRRYAAIVCVLLPLSALPLLAAAGLAAAGGADIQLAHFAGPWLVHLAPLVLAVGALTMAWGMLAGGEIAGLVAAMACLAATVATINAAVALFRLRLGDPFAAWLGGDPTAAGWGQAIERLPYGFFPFPASEAPFDFARGGFDPLIQALLPLGVAAASLALAMLHQRRTRPDTGVERIPAGHAAPGLLRLFHRLRAWAAVDAGLERRDFAAAATCLVVGLGLIAAAVAQAAAVRGLTVARYAAERDGGPAPTDPSILPETWSINGRVMGSTVETQVEATVSNRGREPRAAMAFTLAPGLAVRLVGTPGVRITARRWDRLAVAFAPSLAPGERRLHRFVVEGVPVRSAVRDTSFVRWYRRQLESRFARDLADASHLRPLPSAGPAGTWLEAAMLAPVPRYTSWQLTDDEQVPRELVAPVVSLHLVLRTRRGVLADSCGAVSRRETEAMVLRSGCATPLADYAVAGGEYQVHAVGDGVRLLTFAQHRGQAELHAASFRRAADLLATVWPDMDGLSGVDVVEWPWYDPWDTRNDAQRWEGRFYHDRQPLDSLQLRGRLLRFSELDLIGFKPLPADRLAAAAAAAKLALGRPAVAEERELAEHLLRGVARQCLGLGPPTGAVVTAFTGGPGPVEVPALTADFRAVQYWELRFPALLADLEHRVGRGTFCRELAGSLRNTAGGPWRFEDLLQSLSAASGVSLERFAADFLRGGALPRLDLEPATAARAGSGWEVRGAIRNSGSGEVFCPVVLSTAVDPQTVVVQVADGGTTHFKIFSPYEPQALGLDPDGFCQRYRTPLSRERWRFEGTR